MSTKDDIMKENGSFNRRSSYVSADIFRDSRFFDKKDIVQVKYEMLRAVAKDGGSVTDVSGEFGFSRKTFYQVSHAFGEGGLNGLMPKKTGPKGPSKLRGEVSEFIDAYVSSHEKAKASEIAAQTEAELGICVHPRTIERHLEKKTATT